MATNNQFNTTGVSTSSQQLDIKPEDLAPNNYLTIIWKDTKTNKIVNTLDIDNDSALNYTMQLSSSIDNAISNNNVPYVGQNKYVNLEAIGKYLAQNSIPAGTQRSVLNALITVASGTGKATPDDIKNLCLNVFGNIASDTARELGYTDPINIFSQVAGENVLNVLSTLGKKTQNFINEKIRNINSGNLTNLVTSDGNKDNKRQYVGLLLGITTSDTESMEVTIPRKKVEDGSDYTTHLLPQPYKKDFTVKLTNKVLSQTFNQLTEINAIEYSKDKLFEIARSRTLIDIYIRLSSEKVYKRSNVVISSLSVTKDESSGNSYTATFTIEPVENFKTKTFVSNIKYSSGTGNINNSGGSGNKSSGTTNNRNQKDKTSSGKSLKVGYTWLPNETDTFSSFNEAMAVAKKHNCDIIENLDKSTGQLHLYFIRKSAVQSWTQNGLTTWVRKSDLDLDVYQGLHLEGTINFRGQVTGRRGTGYYIHRT